MTKQSQFFSVNINAYISMKKNRKALETIALGYSQGIVSIDVLVKACDNYKLQNHLIDSVDYGVKVSKSFYDQMNGVPQDSEIAKAIVPGQTKYVDGVLYVYSATKSGSKTDYAWHVARKSKVGKSSKVDDKTVKKLEESVNSLFPADIKSVSVVKAVGGSTGAQLVKDVSGNEYIMKKATKVPAEHVRSEYLSNMLYNILGQKTPDFELYDADSDSDITMLSRFVPGTREPGSNDFAKMGEGFISDVLLANWDVYKNDNCRINAGGEVIRVDNGACLFFRAQGGKKNPPFDSDVERTYNDMLKYNSLVAKCLVPKDLINQIDSIKSKKDDVVNFLKDSGQDSLAKIMAQRIDNLDKIRDAIDKEEKRKEALEAAKAGKIPPRQLKPATEMYAEFDDKDLDAMLDEVVKDCGYSKDGALTYTEKGVGWKLLARICQERGFDGRPNVVTESKFWQAAQQSLHPIMFRGNHAEGDKSGKEFCDLFRYDDNCYYGTMAAWGQGIYAHTDDTNQKWLNDLNAANKKSGSYTDRNTVKYNSDDNIDNKSTDTNYKQSQGYKDADNYANYGKDSVLKLAWEKDAVVVDLDDLLKEIQDNPPQAQAANKAVIDKIKKQMGEIKKKWMTAEDALMRASDIIKDEVHKKFHYDENAITDMYTEIDGTNWGNRNAQNHPDYPKYDKFVLGHMADWVIKNGGKVEIGDEKEYAVFRIGGESLSITRYGWDNNAIKRKNAMTQPYNYHAERFKTFMETNCISTVDKAVKHAIANSSDRIKKMKDEVQDYKKQWYDKKAEYDKETSAASGLDSLRGIIYNRVKDIGPRDSGESTMGLVGIYAAMMGYDGIYVHNGNTSNHGFNVILNRTKVITSIE